MTLQAGYFMFREYYFLFAPDSGTLKSRCQKNQLAANRVEIWIDAVDANLS